MLEILAVLCCVRFEGGEETQINKLPARGRGVPITLNKGCTSSLMITFKVPSHRLRFLPMPKYPHPPLWGSERELQASGSASSSRGLHSLQDGVCSAFARLPDASFPRSSRPPAVCRCFSLPVSRCASSLDRHISSFPGSVLLQASTPVHPSQHLSGTHI